MEEYRSGKLSGRVPRHASAASVPRGKTLVDFPKRTVVVAGCCDATSRRIVKAFIAAGCRTSFCSSDRRPGSLIAQEYGARYYQLDNISSLKKVVEDVADHWNKPDTLVVNLPDHDDVWHASVVDAINEASDYYTESESSRRIIIVTGNADTNSDDKNKYGSAVNIIIDRKRDVDSSAEVASLCVYICQPCGKYLSGQVFCID